MFSCATYPEAPLAAEVELEARAQVARLRGPPVARAVVRQQREPVDPRHAVPRARRRARAGRAVLRRDPAARRSRSSTRTRPTGPARRSAATTTTRARRATRHNWEVWHGQSRRRFGEPGAPRPDARVGRLHPLRGGRGALHLGVRRARRARPRDAAALDPRRPARAPQPGDGPPHQGQPEEQDRHAARVGHGRRRATSTSSSTSR